MNEPLSCLGDLSAEQFLADYWQRKPLLVRAAFPDWQLPVDGDELAGLACEELAQARLVFGGQTGADWRVEYGPFVESRFAELPPTNFSLLVQDVDKWDSAAAALLDAFWFIPGWRFDDVMVSYAAPGGSVGPHFDLYDVFLVQAQGQRQWQIDKREQPDLALLENTDLKLLRDFQPTEQWTLAPGDMLYLPPGIPHHGVALNECMTYSVGMRAPSYSELALDYAETKAEQLAEHLRLTDAGRTISAESGQIDTGTIERVTTILHDTLNCQSAQTAIWFANYMSRYRLDHAARPRGNPFSPTQLMAFVEDERSASRNPWARFTWHQTSSDRALLFVNGEQFETTPGVAALLCRHRELAPGQLRQLSRDGAADLMLALVNAGFWGFPETEDGTE